MTDDGALTFSLMLTALLTLGPPFLGIRMWTSVILEGPPRRKERRTAVAISVGGNALFLGFSAWTISRIDSVFPSFTPAAWLFVALQGVLAAISVVVICRTELDSREEAAR
jgi:hypothetical protein